MKLIDTSSLPIDHPALVPDFWTRSILADPRVEPALAAQALTHVGLPTSLDPERELAVTQYHEAELLRFLSHEMDDPLFAARAAQDHDPRRGTILTYISLSASNVLELMQLADRYIPITRTRVRMNVARNPRGAVMTIDNARSEIANHSDHMEFTIGALAHTVRVAAGQPLNMQVFLGHDCRPTAQLSQIWGCPVTQHTGSAELHIAEEDLDKPLISADNRLLRHLSAYGDLLLRNRRNKQSGIRDKIETVVLPRLSQGLPTLNEVADALALSPRTLSRRLAQEHLSFRQVVETLRYDLARHYLADPDLPLAEIAFLLGFSDQSSFGTAFRRWTGDTPRKYRNAL